VPSHLLNETATSSTSTKSLSRASPPTSAAGWTAPRRSASSRRPSSPGSRGAGRRRVWIGAGAPRRLSLECYAREILSYSKEMLSCQTVANCSLSPREYRLMAILETTTTAAAAAESAKLQRQLRPLRHPVLPDLHDRRRGTRSRPWPAAAARRSPGWCSSRSRSSCRKRCCSPSSARRFPQEGGPYFWTRLAFGQPRGRGEQLPLLDHEPGRDRRHPRGRLRGRDRSVLQQREPAVPH